MMINPDGPSLRIRDAVSQQTNSKRLSVFNQPNRQFVHWVIVNIPENDLSAGHTVCPYIPACPLQNIGAQRYFFVLFRQDHILSQKKLEEAEILFEPRGGMAVFTWASQNGMGLPVGVNGFTTQWEEWCEKIHFEIGLIPPPDYRSAGQLQIYGQGYPTVFPDDEGSQCCSCSLPELSCCTGDETYRPNSTLTKDAYDALASEDTPCCSSISSWFASCFDSSE